jgi:hypothetical protein
MRRSASVETVPVTGIGKQLNYVYMISPITLSLAFLCLWYVRDHLITVLGSLGSRFSCSRTFRTPAPNRCRMLVRLGFSMTTTVRMVVAENFPKKENL